MRETGLEPVRPKTGDFKSPVATITPLSHYLVLPRGIEPRSSDLQTGAMTTSAKAAKKVFERQSIFLKDSTDCLDWESLD